MTGDLAPGDPLVEATLAEWYQVSRTPVREALRRLEQDGLIVRDERGLMVRESTPEEVLDLYETRICLEAMAARVAAERRTDHDLLAMRRIMDRMEVMPTGDATEMSTANVDFHRAVWRASRNLSLIDLLERLGLHLSRYPVTTLGYPGQWQRVYAEHRQLVDAIEARGSDEASRLASEHFTASRDIRIKMWQDED